MNGAVARIKRPHRFGDLPIQPIRVDIASHGRNPYFFHCFVHFFNLLRQRLKPSDERPIAAEFLQEVTITEHCDSLIAKPLSLQTKHEAANADQTPRPVRQ